jgi:uncharacterized protein DUF3179
VWKAESGGRKLTFHLAGINNQNFLMQDEETGSWWQQVTGEAVAGPLRGQHLEPVFHEELTFALWKREQPRGRVLRPEESVPWRKFSQDWETKTAKAPVVTPRLPGEPLPPREVVVGVRLGDEAKAYPLAALRRQSPVIDDLGGVPVVLVVGDDGRSVRGFRRAVDGRELQLFAKPGSKPLRLVDGETASEWSFAGEALSGPLAGKRLEPVFVLLDYWFDWRTYNPKTAVYALGTR